MKAIVSLKNVETDKDKGFPRHIWEIKFYRYSDRLHDFSVTIPRCYKDVYVNSFFQWLCLCHQYTDTAHLCCVCILVNENFRQANWGSTSDIYGFCWLLYISGGEHDTTLVLLILFCLICFFIITFCFSIKPRSKFWKYLNKSLGTYWK